MKKAYHKKYGQANGPVNIGNVDYGDTTHEWLHAEGSWVRAKMLRPSSAAAAEAGCLMKQAEYQRSVLGMPVVGYTNDQGRHESSLKVGKMYYLMQAAAGRLAQGMSGLLDPDLGKQHPHFGVTCERLGFLTQLNHLSHAIFFADYEEQASLLAPLPALLRLGDELVREALQPPLFSLTIF